MSLISSFSVPIFINYYIKSKSVYFLLFALVFIFSSIVLVVDALVSLLNKLIIIKIHHIPIDIIFFILFLHSIRIRWIKHPIV